MRVAGQHLRTIAVADDGWRVNVIDQRRLPFELVIVQLASAAEAAVAIRDMMVRGAPLIGATAAYGIALAMRVDPSDDNLDHAITSLLGSRPTAVDLRAAVQRMRSKLVPCALPFREAAAYAEASAIAELSVSQCAAIGRHGMELLRGLAAQHPDRAVNVLTHCNAGWLACVDWGTALAPIYAAHDADLRVHVYVDETRPRNQGAALTAFELAAHGVPHTLICDNAGGHLMQHGRVDLCIVGCDRLTAEGDVTNKIGTYLKALAAFDNGVPFYVALPSTTIDWTIRDGLREVPIEERAASEVTRMTGRDAAGRSTEIEIAPYGTPAANPAFDVTPHRLVTGLITERGIAAATNAGLLQLYPEHATPLRHD